MNKPLFKIKNITKVYGQGNGATKALNNISLTINEGELLCVLGDSGSGKSTLLNLLGGLDKPTSGSIYFNDLNIASFKNSKSTQYRCHEIGFIFQFFNLLDELNVYQNITIIPGCNKKKDSVEKLLSSMGLKGYLKKYPRELSGGEQQRVCIARAINKSSRVILADEPTGALDYKSGKDILKLIETLHKKDKKTIILVTHNTEIAKMCDRIIKLKSGKIIDNYINKNKKSSKDINW